MKAYRSYGPQSNETISALGVFQKEKIKKQSIFKTIRTRNLNLGRKMEIQIHQV